MPKGSAQAVLDEATMVLPLAGLIDLAAERTRLAKERDKAPARRGRSRDKLDNADFVRRAPEEVVEENRERLATAQAEIARLEAALAASVTAPKYHLSRSTRERSTRSGEGEGAPGTTSPGRTVTPT